MSISRIRTITCPICQTENTLPIFESINADLRPDLKAAILDGSLHQTNCTHCQASLRVPPSLVYLDIGGGLAVVVFAAQDRERWTVGIDEAQKLIASIFGAGPGVEMARSLTIRLVFGWSALREKIIIQEAGLNDLDVEITKLALIRTSPTVPVADNLDLRLTEVADGMITMSWVSVETGAPIEHLRFPVDTIDSVQPSAPAWASIREDLSVDPFVDHNRFLLAL